MAGSGMIATGCDPKGNGLLGKTQIQHGVIFSLKHERGSEAANRYEKRETFFKPPKLTYGFNSLQS